MNIVLIGFRGAGKTAIGKILSEKTGMELYSVDKIIEQMEGKKIREIVSSKGWPYFRELESKVIEELSNKDDIIIDTGGGAIENQFNIDNLRKNGYIIFVSASLKDIKKRILSDPDRPKLNPTLDAEDDLVVAFNRRLPVYEENADFKVNTSTNFIDECVNQILKFIGF